jgi:hypothetical protein
MFRENNQHLQKDMFSTLDELPAHLRSRLESSWAGTFYRECFMRINEEPFRELFSEIDSRPNVPVNVLIGLEILKAGFGWSDEQLYDHFCFDIQVRYALGYRTLHKGHFSLRTLYNFRRRVLKHFCRTGVCLFEQAFEQVTDDQAKALGLNTTAIRVDSTQVASNIRNFSRLHLLVEVLHRVYRMLSDADRLKHSVSLEDYVKYRSDQFVYNVSSDEGRAYIEKIGPLMAQLVEALAATYGNEPDYQMLERVLDEQYIQEGDKWRPRQKGEFPSACLCAPHDPEATMRRKGNQMHKGYVTNLAETCAAENQVQLIVKVRTGPNVTADSKLLRQDLYSLKYRLGISECITDGGYNNEEMYRLMRDLRIQHWQTGIQGHPSTRYLEFWRYQLWRTSDGQPLAVVCPMGLVADVFKSKKPGHYRACFDRQACINCEFAGVCLAQKRKTKRTLTFSDYDADIARRRKWIHDLKESGRNPRAAVESTVYSVKRPFGGKLPVRGLLRIQHLMTCSAWMTNVRRLNRFWRQGLKPLPSMAQVQPALSLLRLTWHATRQVLASLWRRAHHLAAAPCVC